VFISYSSAGALGGPPKGHQELHNFICILVARSGMFWNDVLAESWFPVRLLLPHLWNINFTFCDLS